MIYDKLFKIQEEAHKFRKDAKNPFFKSDYLSLEGLMKELSPILTEHKLLVHHYTEDNMRGNGRVCTEVIDSEETKEDEVKMVVSCMPLPEGIEPQKIGSAVTYFKRYNLGQIFNILTDEDDDANSSSPKNTGRKKWDGKVKPPTEEDDSVPF